MHLARDAVHGQAVRPVGRDLQLEHVIADRQVALRLLARLVRVGQDHDAFAVGAQL